VDVEGLAGQPADGGFENPQLVLEVFGQPAQPVDVHADPPHLHAREDRDERHLHRVHELGQADLAQPLREHRVGHARDVGILAGIGDRLLQGDLRESGPVLALADHLIEGDALVVEKIESDLVQVVGALGRVQ